MGGFMHKVVMVMSSTSCFLKSQVLSDNRGCLDKAVLCKMVMILSESLETHLRDESL